MDSLTVQEEKLEIDVALDKLTVQCQGLVTEVVQLYNKLTPVLVPRSEVVCAEIPPRDRIHCPLAETIIDEVIEIADTRRIVCDLLKRVQL